MGRSLRELFGIFRPAKTARPARRTPGPRQSAARVPRGPHGADRHRDERDELTRRLLAGSLRHVRGEVCPQRDRHHRQPPGPDSQSTGRSSRPSPSTHRARTSSGSTTATACRSSWGSPLTFNGSGTNNILSLFGSRAIDTNAQYTVRSSPSTASTLVEDNLTFNVASNFTQVVDTLQDTGGPLTVNTEQQRRCDFVSSSRREQSLSNLGPKQGSKHLLRQQGPGRVERERALQRGLPREPRSAASRRTDFTLQMNAQNDVADVLARAGRLHPQTSRPAGNEHHEHAVDLGALNIERSHDRREHGGHRHPGVT